MLINSDYLKWCRIIGDFLFYFAEFLIFSPYADMFLLIKKFYGITDLGLSLITQSFNAM